MVWYDQQQHQRGMKRQLWFPEFTRPLKQRHKLKCTLLPVVLSCNHPLSGVCSCFFLPMAHATRTTCALWYDGYLYLVVEEQLEKLKYLNFQLPLGCEYNLSIYSLGSFS